MSKFIFSSITRTRPWRTRATPLWSPRACNRLPAQPCRRYAQVHQSTPTGARDRSAIGVRRSSSATNLKKRRLTRVFRCSRRQQQHCSSLPVSACFITSSMKSGSCRRKKVSLVFKTWALVSIDLTIYYRERARISFRWTTPCWWSIHTHHIPRQTLLGKGPLGQMEFRILWIHQLPGHLSR